MYQITYICSPIREQKSYLLTDEEALDFVRDKLSSNEEFEIKIKPITEEQIEARILGKMDEHEKPIWERLRPRDRRYHKGKGRRYGKKVER